MIFPSKEYVLTSVTFNSIDTPPGWCGLLPGMSQMCERSMRPITNPISLIMCRCTESPSIRTIHSIRLWAHARQTRAFYNVKIMLLLLD